MVRQVPQGEPIKMKRGQNSIIRRLEKFSRKQINLCFQNANKEIGEILTKTYSIMCHKN